MSKRERKRIWIDVLTPKQALFAKAMVERAPSGVELVATTRDYSELNEFLKQIDLKHISFGRHGGALPRAKLEASVERMRELTPFVASGGFDCSFSFISPEAARVSFGLGLDHFICSDSPHANAPSRLAIPLARAVFSPFPLSRKSWTRYGIESSRVFLYHALDPWAWLLTGRKNGFRLGNRKDGSTVLVRLEESFASYLKPGKGISSVLPKLVRAIHSSGDYEIVVIPRYDEQRAWARREFGKSCTVPEGTVDGLKLVEESALVIGGGGTMTQEAALVGIPNISYFPSVSLDVFERYYFPKKLSVKASTPQELITRSSNMLSKIDTARKEFGGRAKRAVRSFEDPVAFVYEKMLHLMKE